MAVAGVAGRHHAIEHVDAAAHPFHQILRLAHPHQVARLVGRDLRADVIQDAVHVFLGLTHRQTADRIAVEADLQQTVEGDIPQRLVDGALNDAEQGVLVAQCIKLLAGALGPAQGHLHGLARLFVGRRIGRALVEDHHDVGAQIVLDLHGFLGVEEDLLAVDGMTEMHPLLGDLANVTQAEHLETTGVGQDGALPVHEIMQIPVGAHHRLTRPQPEVEGVAKQDLGAGLAHLFRGHPLDGAVGTDRHEGRGLDHTALEYQLTATGATICGFQFKFHCYLDSVRETV
ncbi:hypothetical protein D3C79_655180 [compost metagenome]